ncbi:MAG: hypothetical protein AB7V13_22660 [Pseudorhodoplanes sp.]|uniref:hypothetical protein n=1 Tax=Pseudorhodoplanes sp. TaxID=1934341 RepID=UPI003D0BF0FA
MSRRRADMTPEQIARAREQERERSARRRERSRPGHKLVLLPADVVDELGDDENVAARAIDILRRYLVKSMRDRA